MYKNVFILLYSSFLFFSFIFPIYASEVNELNKSKIKEVLLEYKSLEKVYKEENFPYFYNLSRKEIKNIEQNVFKYFESDYIKDYEQDGEYNFLYLYLEKAIHLIILNQLGNKNINIKRIYKGINNFIMNNAFEKELDRILKKKQVLEKELYIQNIIRFKNSLEFLYFLYGIKEDIYSLLKDINKNYKKIISIKKDLFIVINEYKAYYYKLLFLNNKLDSYFMKLEIAEYIVKDIKKNKDIRFLSFFNYNNPFHKNIIKEGIIGYYKNKSIGQNNEEI